MTAAGKSSNNFHEDYRQMLGESYIKAVQRNPYEDFESAKNAPALQVSPLPGGSKGNLFKKKKGYF